MSADDVKIPDLLLATDELFGMSTPGVWFREHFCAAPYREEMRELREILKQAPDAGTEAFRLIEAIEREDAVHDRHVRFGRGYLSLLSEHHWDPAVRAEADELAALLFPAGAELVKLDPEDEVERGEARAAALSPELTRRLSLLSVPRRGESDPATFADWMSRHLQASSSRLGLMIAAARRLTLPGQPTPMELIAAKHRYAELTRLLLQTIRESRAAIPAHQATALERVQRRWTTTVRDATSRAAREAVDPRPIWEPTL